MLKKIQKDITDEDIDQLFNDNNTNVLKDKEEIVPEELSINNNKKSNHIDRPPDPVAQKSIQKNINDIIDKKIDENFRNVKEIHTLEQFKKYIKKVLNYRKEEEFKQHINNCIINGVTNTNIDKNTDCTFHIYQPQHIMGDTIYCKCKFCSVMKEFSQSEWDEYCIKYRKWF